MSFVNRLLSIMALLALVACGGGGGAAGDAPFGNGGGGGGGGGGTGSTPAASDLVLVLSATSVANNGSESVVATATAIDASRNSISGVPVTISVNSNGIVTPTGTKTDEEGVLEANVSIGSDRSEREMTVTATTGSISRTATLRVVASGSVGGTGPTDLLLVLSAPTIANNDTETVTATVTALDAKRNVLPGVVVSLSVDNDATVLPSGTSTASNGTVTGAIRIGANRNNRTITVTASAGGLVRSTPLQVINAATSPRPTAADLTLSLSAGRLDNGGTNEIVATVTAVDASRVALPGIPVTFTVDSSAVARVVGNRTTTDTDGRILANVGIGSDRSNRVITVTASSGTLTRSASFTVEGAKLTAAFAPQVSTSSTGNAVEFTLVDTNTNPMSNVPIAVTAPGLPPVSGVTGFNGKFTYTYTAPTVASTLELRATAAGASLDVAVQVQPAGGGTIPVAVGTVQSASIATNPSVVSVNLPNQPVGTPVNEVELRALFLGPDNKPIQNIRARFDLAGNASNSDGVVSWLGGNYVYSDSTGVARATFRPGQRSSPTNGVTVRVCYASTDWDFAATPCPNSAITTLTVTSEALSVSISTNALIENGRDQLTYIKKFVVMVVDAAGQAKADVLITPSVDLPAYYKGFYEFNGSFWVRRGTLGRLTLASTESWAYNAATQAWERQAPTTQPACPNEDVNRNGVREAAAFVPGAAAPPIAGRQEDLNWNGELDSRKADVAIKMVGGNRTDANGLAVVQIEYGKSIASWVDYVITVTASGISGSEARARFQGLLYGVGALPTSADDIADEARPPAFVVSPYGTGTVCTDTD